MGLKSPINCGDPNLGGSHKGVVCSLRKGNDVFAQRTVEVIYAGAGMELELS